MLRPKRPFARAATPTPEPGGAQQVAGVEGAPKSTLFNGEVRVRKTIPGKASGTPEESSTDTPQTTRLA